MKTIIFHIGNPKTGTSSIQRALSENKKKLENKGLLYPLEHPRIYRKLGWERFRNHRWLVLLVEPERSKWPRSMRARISKANADYALKNARKSFSTLLNQIQRSPAERVVISSESMGRWNEQKLKKLEELFAPLDAKFEVLCYYRNPANSFLARIQQQLKASGSSRSFVTAVRPISMMHANYSAVFGDVVSIRLFDRALLKNGDVVADFLSAVGVDDQTIESLENIDKNISGPGELTAAQYWIRSRAFQDLEGNFSGANKRLNSALLRASADIDLGRAKLAPGVTETAYYHNRDELRWLKDHLGLEFDEINYDSLDNPPPVDLEKAELSDLVQFDQEKVDLIIARAMRDLCEAPDLRIPLDTLRKFVKAKF